MKHDKKRKKFEAEYVHKFFISVKLYSEVVHMLRYTVSLHEVRHKIFSFSFFLHISFPPDPGTDRSYLTKICGHICN
jgi:hypothetical protein